MAGAVAAVDYLPQVRPKVAVSVHRPGCPLTTAAPAAPSERSTTLRGMNDGKALEL
jgi:hypothetical protein